VVARFLSLERIYRLDACNTRRIPPIAGSGMASEGENILEKTKNSAASRTNPKHLNQLFSGWCCSDHY
jgi:hypothetical protein